MTEEMPEDNNPKPAETEEANAGETAAPEAAPETAVSGETPADVAFANLAAEAADLKDRLLRQIAEMENLRRRTEREIGDAKQYAVSGFARDMLVVVDNLRRALDAVPEEERGAADTTLGRLLEGISLTERELLHILDRHGVKKLEPKGEKFDPHRHQAMFEVEDPSAEGGTVVQVIQDGYVIGERVLRPALVGVAKKPKPAPKAEENAAAEQPSEATPADPAPES